MIRFEQFGWRFADASSWAVRDISLTIGRGEFVVIAGPSGSGKTTLALAMCGLLLGRHDGEAEGHVYVSGEDVAVRPLHRTAETIALVQQNPETHFATLTVRDELAFGMENRCLAPDEIRRRRHDALAWLGISHLAERDLATLSGGEKQRVAVASILAASPAGVVLDEPTASLDPKTSRALFTRLASLSREHQLTVVLIEHKLDQLAGLHPRFVFLRDGLMAPASQQKPIALPDWLPQSRQETAPGECLADLSHVSVNAGGRDIVKDVSLRVFPGEVVALTGPNGSGKSTLLHTMTGLVKLSDGSARICGRPISSTRVAAMAGLIGVVFQNADHQIVSHTVWNEALFTPTNLGGMSPAIEEQATNWLAVAGLADRKAAHPYRLSWGQKRRLNLISALLHRPRLILLDEPFAGQDTESLAYLLDAIHSVVRGFVGNDPERWGTDSSAPRGACVIVTHDPRIITGWATRVVFLDDGRVLVDAPVAQATDRLPALGFEAYLPQSSQASSGSVDSARVERGVHGVLSSTNSG